MCLTSLPAAIHPAETHPDVELYAIASRDASSAGKAAKSYKFKKSYGSYQALLDDPQVDMVYVSTPNGLHYEWASKALAAGKHVLLEKPFTANGFEAKKLVQEAEKSGKDLMEAFHWQFHPAAHAWRQIIDSGAYGPIIATNARMVRLWIKTKLQLSRQWLMLFQTASPGVPDGDIRWQFDLAGGSCMDCTYALNFTRYALRTGTPEKILSAVARPYSKDKRVDAAMNATILFRDCRGDIVQSRVYMDMARAWISGVVPPVWELPAIEVETDKAIIYFYNAMMPHLYHYIFILDKATGKTTYKKQYSGGPIRGDVETSGVKGGKSAWSTYRWQLEAFVSKVKGRQPTCWVTGEESITQMETIDMVYQKAGLPARPGSS